MSTEYPALLIPQGGRFGKPVALPTFPQTPGLSLGAATHFQPFERIDISEILLRPQGKSIRPGGDATNPKPFSLRSQRQIRYKKVGIRRMYSIKQLLSVRDSNRKFPFAIDPIANVFEEGLGEEIGRPKTDELAAVAVEEKVQESGSSSKLSERSGGRRYINSSKKKEPDQPKSRSVEASDSTNLSSTPSRPPSATQPPKKKQRWVPPSLRARKNEIIDPLEVFERNIRSILNKITLDTFDDLAPRVVQFFEEEVTDAAGLYKLVSLIFEKTIQEPLFGPLYAGVCVQLSEREKKLTVTEKKDDGSQTVRQLGFKQALLKQCQREFEKGKRDIEIRPDMSQTDKEEAQMKQKRILIGTIQFIGQLYLHDLLTNKIIKQCIIRLLSQGASEEDIECVCELLRNVGQKLDESVPEIGVYYRRLQNISKDKDYKIRIRFMARNLLELRERGWTDDVQKKELRKKQEIREEFEQEKGGRKRQPVSTFDEADPSQIAAVMDSDGDLGLQFGIKKFDVDVIGVDVSATEKLRHEPSLGMNYYARYKKPRETREAPEQRVASRANRKERHRNFLLASQNVSVNVVAPAKLRRRPIEIDFERPGIDTQFDRNSEEFTTFKSKVKVFYDNYAVTTSVTLRDTLNAIKKIGAIDRALLAQLYFEEAAQAYGRQRELGARIIFALLDEGFISAAEFSDGLSAFFEFLVDMELDCPNVFENCAFILAQLFDDGIVQMDQLHVWLSKDESLTKWYIRKFDRDPQEQQRKSEEASNGFTKRDKFVAKMIAELGKLNGDRAKDEMVAIMTEQRFDLSVYVPQSRRSSFVREFDLQDYL